MAGQTEIEAVENYAGPIVQTLACVSATPLVIACKPDSKTLLFEAKPPLGVLNGTGFQLAFFQKFTPITLPDGMWKVRTDAYVYIVHDERTRPIVQYDWHPHRDYLRRRPHLHIKHGSTGPGTSGLRPGLSKMHFPSGRLAIEELVRFLIEENWATPLCADWDDILARNLERFEAHRSWA